VTPCFCSPRVAAAEGRNEYATEARSHRGDVRSHPTDYSVRDRGASCSRPRFVGKRKRTALCVELDDEELRYERQRVAAHYKGRSLGEYVIDVVVEKLVVVEIKAVERIAPVFEAQILHYMGVSHKRIGLLMNFNSRLMKDGINRFAL
jgi:GxxExxY protein